MWNREREGQKKDGRMIHETRFEEGLGREEKKGLGKITKTRKEGIREREQRARRK